MTVTKIVHADELRRFASDALQAVGCSPEEAGAVSDALVDADLRGLHSHGALRLPVYLAGVRGGGIVPDAPMRWLDEDGATARLSAASGFGQIAMQLATDRAIELVGIHGAASVGVVHSTHFGIGARWAERLTAAGAIGIIVSNTGPCVAPFGSREALLGTNPIAIAIPTSGSPIVLDMATSEAAYGRIVGAKLAGETIPDTWAVDADGQPTTDPVAALGGALLPFGAHKGSGIATVLEALIGAMTGANFSHEVTDIWTDPSSQMGTGHLVLALRPLIPAEQAMSRADGLVHTIGTSSPAANHDRVLLPGQREHERAAGSADRGIEMPGGLEEQLLQVAEETGVAQLQVH